MDIQIEEGHPLTASQVARMAAATQIPTDYIEDHLRQITQAYSPETLMGSVAARSRQIGAAEAIVEANRIRYAARHQIELPDRWTEPCMVCGAPSDVSEADYCCSGGMWEQCGCGGRPQGPVACSETCMDALMLPPTKKNGKWTSPECLATHFCIPPWFDPETLFTTLP